MTDNPRRPTYGVVRVGKTNLKVKINWDAYEQEKEKTGKTPTHFTVDAFNKTGMRVARDRLRFIAGR